MTTTTFPQQPATKTQINNLQRGHGRLGIIGSSYDLRSEISWRVNHENPEVLNLMYKGNQYSLHISYSCSGKTFWYYTDQLPVERVREIVPFDTKAINNPELVSIRMRLNMDMTIEFVTSRRRSERAQWKPGQTIEIAERDITIL